MLRRTMARRWWWLLAGTGGPAMKPASALALAWAISFLLASAGCGGDAPAPSTPLPSPSGGGSIGVPLPRPGAHDAAVASDSPPSVGTLGCADLAACLQRCPDTDAACPGRCQASATPDAVRALQGLVACATQSGCMDSGCQVGGGGLERSRGCSNDFDCGIGNRCVKQNFTTTGVCMTSVDQYGVQQFNTPSIDPVMPKMPTSTDCRFDTDCPILFRCDSGSGACIKR